MDTLKRFFNGLSLTQILAAAFAAMTALLLSNRIGVAGSIVGAAISSIVSTLATTVYKNALTEGRRIAKKKAGLEDSAELEPGGGSAGSDAGAAGAGTAGSGSASPAESTAAYTQALADAYPQGWRDAPYQEAGNAYGSPKQQEQEPVSTGPYGKRRRIASASSPYQQGGSNSQSAWGRRIAISLSVLLVGILAALVALWITSSLITQVSGGSGWGRQVTIIEGLQDSSPGISDDSNPEAAPDSSHDADSAPGTTVTEPADSTAANAAAGQTETTTAGSTTSTGSTGTAGEGSTTSTTGTQTGTGAVTDTGSTTTTTAGTGNTGTGTSGTGTQTDATSTGGSSVGATDAETTEDAATETDGDQAQTGTGSGSTATA